MNTSNNSGKLLKSIIQSVQTRAEVADQATSLLKESGVKGLRPSEYGSNPHATAREVVQAKTRLILKDSVVVSQREMGLFARQKPASANITVSEHLNQAADVQRKV